jgi:hypothetical protein
MKQNIAVTQLIVPAVKSATITPTTSSGVDLQNAFKAAVIVQTGALVGAAVYNFQLQESNDNATWTNVADAQTDPDILPTATAAASSLYRIGYSGNMRYIALLCTLVSGTSLAISACVVADSNELPV